MLVDPTVLVPGSPKECITVGSEGLLDNIWNQLICPFFCRLVFAAR